MTVLRYVESFLFDSPVGRVIAVLFAIMLFRTGIWYIPNLEEARAIAVNPFVRSHRKPLCAVLVMELARSVSRLADRRTQ